MNSIGAQTSELTLADGGQSAYGIRLAPNAGVAAEFAAAEFQQFFLKTCRVKLDIRKDHKPQAPWIWIGNLQTDPALRQALGSNLVGRLTASRHFLSKDEYFAIATAGSNVLIAGSGSRGVCYGVYEFLERFLDCGFGQRDFDANYVSETVRPQSRIALPAKLEIVQGPAFPVRTLVTHWGPRGSNAPLWGLRQRCNVIDAWEPEKLPAGWQAGDFLVPQGHHHGFYQTMIKLAGEAHARNPSAFDLEAARRVEPDGSRVSGNLVRPNMLCFSSPATVALFTTGIKAYVEKYPAAKIVLLTVPDGGFYRYPEYGSRSAQGKPGEPCCCAACQAELQRIDKARRAGEYVDWGEFVLKFRNAVIEQVVKDYPDLRFVSLAYINYSANPRKVPPHANMLVWFTPHQADSLIHDGQTISAAPELLAQWVSAARDSRQITIWNARARRRAFCAFEPVFEEEAPLYLKYQLGGGNVRPGMPYSYFRARMLWDPSVPRDQVVADYTRRNYHAAADAMREVFDKMQAGRGTNPSEPLAQAAWRDAATGAKARAEICDLLARARKLVADDPEALRNVQVDEALIKETAFAELQKK